jgi:hypothetical protein
LSFLIGDQLATLTYDNVKDKARTLRAMTSLGRAEFEELYASFKEAWDERVNQEGRDVSKGGRQSK